MPIAIHDTAGMPPVRKTADQRVMFCTSIETRVTVSGVEYFRPKREETSAPA
jgi:hypothetical protein